MAKKTLEEKINCVKWSALLFAIVYFLIGAWLKSDGPFFDSDKAYELIRDSLTLTAYFLAPIAAFVLFSDWREQHKAQKLELDSENIIRKIYEANSQLLTLMNATCSGLKDDLQVDLKVFQLKNELLLKSKSITHDSVRLKKICSSEIIFIMSAISIANLISEGATLLHELHCEYVLSDKDYIPDIEFMTLIFNKIESQMNDLNDLALRLQI